VSALEFDALNGRLTGDVIVPGSRDYEFMRKPAMARFNDVRPVAIVRGETPADVSATIRFAKRTGLPLSIRCGGHSVAGRSCTEGILVDVTPMRSVAVSDGIVTVGAGVRLGDLYEALYEHGVTIPPGCGPSVGIADAFVSRAQVKPSSTWSRQMAFPAAKRQLNDLDQSREASPRESSGKGHVYTKSEFFRRALDRQTIAALVQNLSQEVAGAGAREVAFMPWGGAYNQMAPDATAQTRSASAPHTVSAATRSPTFSLEQPGPSSSTTPTSS